MKKHFQTLISEYSLMVEISSGPELSIVTEIFVVSAKCFRRIQFEKCLTKWVLMIFAFLFLALISFKLKFE